MKPIIGDSNNTVVDTIKKASCSSGWLKTLNQIIFGMTACLCFVVIIMMVVNDNDFRIIRNRSKCHLVVCELFCYDFDLEDDNDLVKEIQDLRSDCYGFGTSLLLENANFPNNTMPKYWLHNFPVNISVLIIVGGNLRAISSYAFFSETFQSLQILTFDGVTIENLDEYTFKGLNNIIELNIRDTHLLNIANDALTILDNSLITLKVQRCTYWNPLHLTGGHVMYTLKVVDFTNNDFGDIITKETFKALHNCSLLYLSSSHITSIELGAFDHLYKIYRITLYDNQLMTLPTGLFDHITSVIDSNQFRVDLHINRWHCDCNMEYVKELVISGYAMTDIICVTPPNHFGKYISSINLTCELETTYFVNTLTDISTRTALSVRKEAVRQICPNLTHEVLIVPCDGGTNKFFDLAALDAYVQIITNKTLEIMFYFHSSEIFSAFMEIAFQNITKYDLIWFRGECYEEATCIHTVSNIIELPKNMSDGSYTYCLVDKDDSKFDLNMCVRYHLQFTPDVNYAWRTILGFLFVASIMVSTSAGACIVCIAIRRNPVLLKGSKRVIFVKHRTTNALVLPHKFKEITTISEKVPEVPSRMIRNESNISTPSYVSAVSPTAEQLNTWRHSHEYQMQYSLSIDDFNVENIYEDLISFSAKTVDCETENNHLSCL